MLIQGAQISHVESVLLLAKVLRPQHEILSEALSPEVRVDDDALDEDGLGVRGDPRDAGGAHDDVLEEEEGESEKIKWQKKNQASSTGNFFVRRHLESP